MYFVIEFGLLMLTLPQVERNTAKRRREMIKAEHILREELERFRLWQQSLGIPIQSHRTHYSVLLIRISISRCDSYHCEAPGKGGKHAA
jgi:hypothetical protein